MYETQAARRDRAVVLQGQVSAVQTNIFLGERAAVLEKVNLGQLR